MVDQNKDRKIRGKIRDQGIKRKNYEKKKQRRKKKNKYKKIPENCL